MTGSAVLLAKHDGSESLGKVGFAMLTHTDVHLLVGVLSSITSPDDVEVELGSRVADEASRTARDVDVTITAPRWVRCGIRRVGGQR